MQRSLGIKNTKEPDLMIMLFLDLWTFPPAVCLHDIDVADYITAVIERNVSGNKLQI